MPQSPQPLSTGLVTQTALASHNVLKLLRDGQSRSVVVLVGAGISVSAGIPDFRTPGTGLYDNLQRYKLPTPEAVFSLDFFQKDPMPFTLLAKELWPSNFTPTPTHLFVSLLAKKSLLRRLYTQNIDGLDRSAGIDDDLLVEAHGSFGAGHCIKCKCPYTQDWIRERIFKGEVARCESGGGGLKSAVCCGLVKPDIVFFGEGLPQKFFKCAEQDFRDCSLVICMGTSLQVQPFASLATRAPREVPRALFNRQVPPGFCRRDEDLVLLGDCDDSVWQFTTALGWTEELQNLIADCREGRLSSGQHSNDGTRGSQGRRPLSVERCCDIQ
eukprot:gnl/TRDRNA2_/TRDRNA2_87287_c0_seq1.p1 gnl/TRDRNA2_/TRDRNA2_87287_c0~~gnl/TRDRNA2_/TRDRNA2_87287_c0_seq1.p1  ORF type:complete len:327 (-),score=33.60 gnl/TRDRNA2_/TRDRNA2_87287_c0_seq1:248-1228(-)